MMSSPPRNYNPWLIAVVVTMATFMEVLDTTIVNVALPHMAGNLSATTDEITWVLTSYLVANAIVLPIAGWCSNVFGRKRFYMSCVGLFTVSSFLCGFAPNLPTLVVCRILQGLGGGGLQPSEQAILVDTFPAEKRGMAFAVAGVAMVTAPILGPTLGGWITDNASWRWCFYINVPVGLLSLMLSSRMVQDPPKEKEELKSKVPFKLDFTGLALIAVSLAATQFMLDKGERLDWFDSPVILTCGIIGLVGLIATIIWELRQSHPVVDLPLFKSRNFAVANALMFTLGFVMFGTTVLLPLLLQTRMGYTATQAGLVLSPGGIVVMIMMPVIGWLVSRVQPKRLVAWGMLMHGVALLMMTRFDLLVDFKTVVLTRCLQAGSFAFLFIPINTMAYAQLPPGKNNNASSLLSLARNMGGSCGIALATYLVTARAQIHQTMLSAHMTPYDPAFLERMRAVHLALPGSRPEAVLYRSLLDQSAMLAYLDVFGLLAALSFCGIGLALLFREIDLKRAPAGAH